MRSIICVLSLILVASLLPGCTPTARQGTETGSAATSTADTRSAAKLPYRYPDIPDVVLSGIPTVRIVPQLEDTDAIKIWMSSNHLRSEHIVQLGSGQTDLFLVNHLFTGGRRIYRLYLFGRCPISLGDHKPWKLLYVDEYAVDGANMNLGCIRVDEKPGIINVLDENAKTIRALDISAQIAVVKKWRSLGT